ncbi:hypothetical protein EV122DRAFT_201377 [Schizophyllum commune]
MIHSNEGLSGYLRLRLTAPVPFIERFSRLKAKFEASLDQMDGNGEQVEENYNEHQHAEEQVEYEQEQAAEQQEQAIPDVGVPQNGDAPDTSAPFEDPSVPTEVPQTTAPDHLDADEAHEAAGETLVSADQDSAATTDVYATATGSADQATEYAEHADLYEEGDEGVEQQSYDEYVEQAEGGQEAIVDFNEQQSGQEYAEEQQEEYNEDGYEEGTYDEKVDEKLYGGEHVAQGASDLAGEGEHSSGNGEFVHMTRSMLTGFIDEHTGHEDESATEQAPDAVAQEYHGDSQPPDPNADPAQLPPLPEDDGDEDDSELTTEGTTYQDPIVVPEPEAQAEGEGEEGAEEEYYEEGEEEEYYEEGEYEEEYEEGAEVGEEVTAGEGEGAPIVEAEAEGAPQQAAADATVDVGGETGGVVEDGEAHDEASGEAHDEASGVADVQANVEAGEAHATVEGEHVAAEDAEAEAEDDEADAEGEDDVDEDGNDTYGFAQYEPDTTADTTLDLHEVATDAVDIGEQHEADVGEQLEVASNISSTTLSSTSPMPPPKASFAEAAEMQSSDTAFSKPSDASFSQSLQSSLSRSAKTPLAKSSSKRSLREVEEDDEEGALSGQEMSPGTKRARVEA